MENFVECTYVYQLARVHIVNSDYSGHYKEFLTEYYFKVSVIVSQRCGWKFVVGIQAKLFEEKMSRVMSALSSFDISIQNI